jgi:hypothetical protein
MANKKVPITERALIQRINRKLANDDEALKKTRGIHATQGLGAYYKLNTNRNIVIDHHVDPVELAKELNVLWDWEQVIND